MSQQFDSRKANPQKTSGLIVSGLLQRSHLRPAVPEHDRNSQRLSSNGTQALQASNFRRDFSSVPIQAVTTLPVQPKLQVGRPRDQYEQEADRVAESVMQTASPTTVSSSELEPLAIRRIQSPFAAPLQRQSASVDEEKKKAAKEVADQAERKKQQAEKEKVAAEEKAVKADKDKHNQDKKKKEDDKVQTQAQPGQIPVINPTLENHLSTQQGSGQPLPESTRTFMESRFHHDFSQVRVHADAQATQALNARAFTHKHDIYFNPAQYQPQAPVGQRLLAHELTHVVQQGAAPIKSRTKLAKTT